METGDWRPENGVRRLDKEDQRLRIKDQGEK
jgi:hypothetical protein